MTGRRAAAWRGSLRRRRLPAGRAGGAMRLVVLFFLAVALALVLFVTPAREALAQDVPLAAQPRQAAQAPQQAASQPRRGPRRAGSWRLEVEAPSELKKLLTTYLDLARFERDFDEDETAAAAASTSASAPADGASAPPGDAGSPSFDITRGELRRLVAAAPAQARKLLETEGYFAPLVTARIEEAPRDATGQQAEETLVKLTVEPGPRTKVRNVVMRFEGPVQESAEGGDAAATGLLASLRKEWPLPVGRDFRQPDWAEAKVATLGKLRGRGYPRANWAGTSAMIDPQDHGARLFLIAESGPLFHFGEITIEGLTYQHEAGIRNLATFRPGTPYSDKLLYDYQEELQKLNLFESVSVAIDSDADKAAATPVTVRLKELKRQQATFGVGASANTGPRVSVEHTNRQLMGWDWQSKTKVEIGRDQDLLQLDLISHVLPTRYRNLLSYEHKRLDAAGTETKSDRLRAGRTRDTERIERTIYAEWQQATIESATTHSRANSWTGNVNYTWRNVDSVILPTRGVIASAELGAGYSFSTDQDNGPFARVLTQVTGYLPIGSWFGNARLELGRVAAKPNVGIPDTLLFRAGGDDSVRGYAYREIGPENADGTAVGARTLVTSTLEIARPISPRRPQFWWAAFIDAGDAVDELDAISLKLGYGVGLRWRSPVGPLRLDLAYGQDTGEVRLHFSVGIAL